jgi:hypothetical protein
MWNGTSKPVELPDHHSIESSAMRIGYQAVKLRP